MRQIAGSKRIVVPDDLSGIRMRVPAGQMVADTFSALGAEPVTINSDGIYDALKTGKVDAQENPLALLDLFKLYEVVRYVSMTSHMWSGFNLLANLEAWTRLPDDVKAIIERNVTKHVRLQRQDQERANARLRTELARRGLLFNDVGHRPVPKADVRRLRHVERPARSSMLVAARTSGAPYFLGSAIDYSDDSS